MILKKIQIRDFKGIHEMTVDVPENGVTISGRNASGKTTIADAFFWTMTGNNYAGLTDGRGGFKVHTQNMAETRDAEVEVTMADTTAETTFRKVLTAKGKLEYYINGVEHQAKEYEAYIAENVSPHIALMTNPNYFAGLSWQDQRALVSALAPVSFADISTNTALIAEITTKDVESWRKSAKKAIETDKTNIQKTNTEIQTITGMIPDTSGVDSAKNEIAKIDAEVENLYSEMNSNANNDTARARLADMKNEIQTFVNDNKAVINKMESDKIAKTTELNSGFAALQREIDAYSAEIKSLQNNVEILRGRFNKRAAEMYADNGDDVRCPLNKEHKCADLVLSEIVKNNRRDIIAKFYEQKEADLNAMEEEGRLNNAKISELTEKMNAAIANRDKHHREMNAAIDKITTEIESKRKNLNAKYAIMQADIDKYEADIRKSDTTDTINKIRIRIADLNARRDELSKTISAQDIADKYNADIQKKETALKQLQKQLEDDSVKLSEGEALIDIHAKTTEDRVNALFNHCCFNMFETLKNGTRQNTCQIMIGGVPYGRGANNAGQVNAGVEICAVFQNHFNIKLPIFIDNAESVNEIKTQDRQIIAMYVTGDPLKIENRI